MTKALTKHIARLPRRAPERGSRRTAPTPVASNLTREEARRIVVDLIG